MMRNCNVNKMTVTEICAMIGTTKIGNWAQNEMTNGHTIEKWVQNETMNGHKSWNKKFFGAEKDPEQDDGLPRNL